MRTRITLVTLILLTIVSCKNEQKGSTSEVANLQNDQWLSDSKMENLAGYTWLNKPTSLTMENSSLKVIAEKGTDFFNNPEDGSITSTAPFLFTQVTGDFVARALVRPDFSSMWNAVALMAHIDSVNWIKFAFENSDATGLSIVSVVTKGVSDDANGVILESQEAIWLKLIRKRNSYSLLWSLDDKDYKMARLTTLPPTDSLKIGIEFQCPVGQAATHELLYFGLENETVKDLRKGV